MSRNHKNPSIIRYQTSQSIDWLPIPSPSATFADLQSAIQKKYNIDPEAQVISRTRPNAPDFIDNVSPSATLQSIGLKHGTIIYLIMVENQVQQYKQQQEAAKSNEEQKDWKPPTSSTTSSGGSALKPMCENYGFMRVAVPPPKIYIPGVVNENKEIKQGEHFAPDAVLVNVIATAAKKQEHLFNFVHFPSAQTATIDQVRQHLLHHKDKEFHVALSDFNLLVYLTKVIDPKLVVQIAKHCVEKKRMPADLVRKIKQQSDKYALMSDICCAVRQRVCLS